MIVVLINVKFYLMMVVFILFIDEIKREKKLELISEKMRLDEI